MDIQTNCEFANKSNYNVTDDRWKARMAGIHIKQTAMYTWKLSVVRICVLLLLLLLLLLILLLLLLSSSLLKATGYCKSKAAVLSYCKWSKPPPPAALSQCSPPWCPLTKMADHHPRRFADIPSLLWINSKLYTTHWCHWRKWSLSNIVFIN